MLTGNTTHPETFNLETGTVMSAECGQGRNVRSGLLPNL